MKISSLRIEKEIKWLRQRTGAIQLISEIEQSAFALEQALCRSLSIIEQLKSELKEAKKVKKVKR